MDNIWFCLRSYALGAYRIDYKLPTTALSYYHSSSRRARKSNLPHFRLNKVRNIKPWLSVRSYLKKLGPQRSVDVIVSAAFIVTLLLLTFLSVEWLNDSVHLHSHLNLEALMWATTIGIFLVRFMTLGNKIHHKYRSVSVLITEQIYLYLQIEQKPKKKDELMVSNSVLKLAADLLKELESPFKIAGLSANPYLFTTVKVVILSALSGVLSEVLGFKLKLHKIKIKEKTEKQKISPNQKLENFKSNNSMFSKIPNVAEIYGFSYKYCKQRILVINHSQQNHRAANSMQNSLKSIVSYDSSCKRKKITL
ncbi:protein phtf-like [Eurosta solidaginis]|uniref:protein phtf-like n=1 Tax=Eurosta solidaginis TaxID=178769 RepID=UPI0035307105